MRKLLLILGLLCLTSQAWAATYYFSSTVSSQTDCTSPATACTTPTVTWAGTETLSTCDGDTLLFKRGDTWEGEIFFACDATIGAYGTGVRPMFMGETTEHPTDWTYTGANNIWTTTLSSSTRVWAVMVGETSTFEDGTGNHNLYRWTGTNSNIYPGNFCQTSSSIAGTACSAPPSTCNSSGSNCYGSAGTAFYVRLWDGADPNTSMVRITQYVANDRYRAMIRFTDSGATVKDIGVVGSASYGMASYAQSVEFYNVFVGASGADGWSPVTYVPSGWDGKYFKLVGSEITGNAAMGNGYGQGATIYSGSSADETGGWLIGNIYHHNAMAGPDLLHQDNNRMVRHIAAVRNISHTNGQWQGSQFDPNILIDGAGGGSGGAHGSGNYFFDTRGFIFGITGYGGALNARAGVTIGGENASPATGNIFNNALFFGTHWQITNFDNISSGAGAISNNAFYHTTFAAYASGTGDITEVEVLADMDSTADSLKKYCNIYIADDSLPLRRGLPTEPVGNALDYIDSDYNHFYRRPWTFGGPNQGNAFATMWGVGGSATCYTDTPSSTCWDLDRLRTNTGEEANSAYGDPLIVSDDDLTFDPHLQAASPARDTGTDNTHSLPSWLDAEIATEIGSREIWGITTSGSWTEDDAGDTDKGYHFTYSKLTSTNVEPASLVEQTTNSVTISFTATVTGWIPYNAKFQIIFPSGFTLNSGGTSAFTSASIDGTFTTSVSGQTVTVTRVGDGTTLLPGAYSGTLTFVKNPSAGAGDTYSIRIVDQKTAFQGLLYCPGRWDGTSCVIAADNAVSGDTFTADSNPPVGSVATSGFGGCRINGGRMA